MGCIYWENPIHQNIVNPIPIPNTIAQACLQDFNPFGAAAQKALSGLKLGLTGLKVALSGFKSDLMAI